METDRNGNLWAWAGDPAAGGAVATGSHLDTVPNGGAYDGAFGVVAGLLAVTQVGRRRLARPVAVAAFADEEGGRFGVATFGSRLATGALDPARAGAARDADGVTAAKAARSFDVDFGPDPERLGRLAAYVELHVEQGRGLADLGVPLAVGTGVWPHGRWRLRLTGAADHAGTTRLADRRDPALPLAAAIDAARRTAAALDAVATVGRVELVPGATNAIPSGVTAWLDARAPDDPTLDRLLRWWEVDVREAAGEHGVQVDLVEESRSPAVAFDPVLSDRVAAVLARRQSPVPRLPTAAGHDAAALAAALPTAMIFVRNPTGVSHSPAEGAAEEDCLAGVEALADVLSELAR